MTTPETLHCAPWRLVWRNAEGGPWVVLATAETLAELRDESASDALWAQRPTEGDPLRWEGPDGAAGAFVWSGSTLVELPALTAWDRSEECQRWARARDWIAAWEDSHDAMWSLWAVRDAVEASALVLAACACAERVLPLVEDDRPREAIEAARAWIAARDRVKEASRDEALAGLWARAKRAASAVRALGVRASEDEMQEEQNVARYRLGATRNASFAASCAIDAVVDAGRGGIFASSAPNNAADAVWYVALAQRVDETLAEEARRREKEACAQTVREMIPLRTVLLGLVGRRVRGAG